MLVRWIGNETLKTLKTQASVAWMSPPALGPRFKEYV